jgi:hypothetical protein
VTTGLRCIASSEAGAKSSKFEPHAISGPLPVDWNESEDMYCLYYRHAAYPGALFTVKCIVMDDMLIVHAASDTAPGNEEKISFRFLTQVVYIESADALKDTHTNTDIEHNIECILITILSMHTARRAYIPTFSTTLNAHTNTHAEVYCVELRTGDFVQFVPKSVPTACTAPLDCEKIYSDLDALQR